MENNILSYNDISDLLTRQKEDIISGLEKLITPPPDPWLTTSDVMAYMKWSRRTLAKYRPEIPFKKMGKLLIKQSDFDKWLEDKFE